MIDALKKLIAALRDELQQYGEMLARLDDQQELVMRRAAEAVMQTVPLVQHQSAIIAQAREVRFGAMKLLCSEMGQPENSSFKDLIPHLPPDYRPLLEALVQENNELLQRIHQRARQNHVLLTRTVESMQRVINSLGIHQTPPVYNESGAMFAATSSPALYEAVG
jgi:flagellar biosynthesis/type III secretory pathway chaperone